MATGIHDWLEEMRRSGHLLNPEVYTRIYFCERLAGSRK